MKKGTAEELLTKLGNKIDQLVKQARNSDYAQKIELEKRIEELKKTRDQLESDIDNFLKEHEGEWRDIEKRGEEFLGEVREAMENFLGRIKKS